MARIDDNTIRVMLVGLIVVLIFYMLLSFGGVETFSVVNIEGTNTVRSGSEQTYQIELQTVDPEQFRTPTHYREQYGRWRLEDEQGEELSPGTETKISRGVYDQSLTIEIPQGHPKIYLIAEIIEYQYSSSDPDGPFLRSNATIRALEELEITILGCNQHSDCNVQGTCLGKFGYCQDNLCEERGECSECTTTQDCYDIDSSQDVVWQCSDSICQEEQEETLIFSIKETFSEPITEPGKVEAGQPPEPKQAPPFLSAGVFVMLVTVVYLVLKKRGSV